MQHTDINTKEHDNFFFFFKYVMNRCKRESFSLVIFIILRKIEKAFLFYTSAEKHSYPELSEWVFAGANCKPLESFETAAFAFFLSSF